MMAVLNRDLGSIQLLMQYGANINYFNVETGDSALSLAVRLGYVEIVAEMLEHQEANINQRNFESLTPLLIACDKGHERLVNLLLN